MGELGFGAVLVQPGHGVPAIARHLRRIAHGDETIGVAGIADDQDAHVAGGAFLKRLTLADENLAVDAEQVLAFHSLFARHAADEQRPVHTAKPFLEVRRRDHARQKRKRAVVQFHHDTVERGQGGLNFNQVQDDGLFRAEKRAGSDAEQERVTDLPGGAGHRDANGSRAHKFSRGV